jgi:hypothetical protein
VVVLLAELIAGALARGAGAMMDGSRVTPLKE